MKSFRLRWITVFLSAALCLTGCGAAVEEKTPSVSSGAACFAKVDKRYFNIWQGSGYEQLYIKGVNLGSGMPGHFPGELAASKQDYLNWFRQIGDMNCNAIRVYTIMMPEFYEALYEYNKTAEKKLYLFQGIWYNEEQILETQDAYDIYDEALQDACHLVDIFHGNASLAQQPGKAYGEYQYDISEYVIGWLIGIESDAAFVGTTNEMHADETKYAGEYLFTTGEASPYETFMCKLGDEILGYEMEHYNMQRPISWCNWPTSDMLAHENEPDKGEDTVTMNVEHIRATDAFEAGVYASYHIYPHYPEFIIYEGKDYVDKDGKNNPYRAYLERLIEAHDMPVLVAEYGVPTSRGMTHFNDITGFHQGNLTETQQAEMLLSMSEDIYESGYCGSLIFSWQDEWFKVAWNTREYTDAGRRAYWNDVQTSEQNYGLMAFEPGEKQTAVMLDGEVNDWADGDIVIEAGDYTLFAKEDAKYLYLLVSGKELSPEADRVIIPVDVTPESGSLQYETCSFSKEADFVLDLQGRDKSVIKVQGYYDRYPVSYPENQDKDFDRSGYGGADGSDFHPIYLCLNRELYFPVTKETIPYRRSETGILRYGNGTPESENYDSLADFCYGEHCIELRIPWGILNFRDPSTKEIEADFHKNGYFSGMNIEQIYLGAGGYGDTVEMAGYTWDNWDQVVYHERLKESYYVMQDYFRDLEITGLDKWKARR